MNDVGKKPIKIEKGKKTIQIKKNKFIDREFLLTKFSNKRSLIISIGLIMIVLIVWLFITNLFVPSVENVKDSVVMIEVYDKSGEKIGTGSGFCIYKSNYIATNFHVIEGAYYLKIITDDNKYYNVNDVLIFDAENDLALLETNVKLKPLKLGTNNIKAGDKITAIGSPKGQLNTVSTGIISNADNDKYLRFTAPISPGSSGGVLLNKKNKVVGITSAIYNSIDAQNINYAVSLEYLKDMYKAYKKNEYHTIQDEVSEGCMNNSNNITSFKSCTESSYNYYGVESFNTLFETTNGANRFSYAMSVGDWSEVYADSNDSVRNDAVAYYKELKKKKFCRDNCNIEQQIDDWDTTEFMINLDILEEDELAFVIADLKNYNSNDDKFYRVEEYPLDAYQKTLILYLIGDRSWNIIHKDNKEDIFNYFDENYNTEDLGAILELLGYRIEYNTDGTLTAWW